MQIISMDRAAPCSSTIDHWNVGECLALESIPSFQYSNFPIFVISDFDFS